MNIILSEVNEKEDKEMTRKDILNELKALKDSGKSPSELLHEYIGHINQLVKNIDILTKEVKILMPVFKFGLVFNFSMDGHTVINYTAGEKDVVLTCVENTRKVIGSHKEGFTPPPVP